MTDAEAIQRLIDVRDIEEWQGDRALADALEIAVKALRDRCGSSDGCELERLVGPPPYDSDRITDYHPPRPRGDRPGCRADAPDPPHARG